MSTKAESDEFCQLLTSITTRTPVKSFFFDRIHVDTNSKDFLRFWYQDPFGYCDIPTIVIDKNELKTKAGRVRKQRLIKTFGHGVNDYFASMYIVQYDSPFE